MLVFGIESRTRETELTSPLYNEQDKVENKTGGLRECDCKDTDADRTSASHRNHDKQNVDDGCYGISAPPPGHKTQNTHHMH